MHMDAMAQVYGRIRILGGLDKKKCIPSTEPPNRPKLTLSNAHRLWTTRMKRNHERRAHVARAVPYNYYTYGQRNNYMGTQLNCVWLLYHTNTHKYTNKKRYRVCMYVIWTRAYRPDKSAINYCTPGEYVWLIVKSIRVYAVQANQHRILLYLEDNLLIISTDSCVTLFRRYINGHLNAHAGSRIFFKPASIHNKSSHQEVDDEDDDDVRSTAAELLWSVENRLSHAVVAAYVCVYLICIALQYSTTHTHIRIHIEHSQPCVGFSGRCGTPTQIQYTQCLRVAQNVV